MYPHSVRLSVTTKIFLGLAAVVLTFGGVSIYSMLQLRSIGRDLELISQTYLPLTQVATQLESYQEQRSQSTSLLLEQAPRSQRRLIGLFRRYPVLVREKLALAHSLTDRGLARAETPEDQAFLQGIDTWLERVERRYGDYFSQAETLFSRLENDAPEEAVEDAVARVRRVEGALVRDLKGLTRDLGGQVGSQVVQAETRESRSAFAIMALALAAVGVALLVTLFVQRTLQPIQRLTEGVKDVSRGHFERRVEVHSRDEIGHLAREFNAMAQALEERDAQLDSQRTALLRAERLAAVGRMAAQVSHEIRNPLSSIGLNAEMLAEELAAARFDQAERAGEARALLSSIAKEVDRLTEITETWLRFARMPRPSLGREDPNALVTSVAAFTAGEMEAAGVRVELQPGEDVPDVLADESQLRRALLNLMRNAREAMPDGGRLVLSTARGPSGVIITVADTGAGIPEEDRERIFDPFFSRKEGGTGLGLALTQQIVHEHGGRISCESAPGRGTRFVLELPLADAEPASPLAGDPVEVAV